MRLGAIPDAKRRARARMEIEQVLFKYQFEDEE
jgi:hypothetical protein